MAYESRKVRLFSKCSKNANVRPSRPSLPRAGLLTVLGDSLDNNIVISRNAAGQTRQ
jgi:hypothetical protein